MLRVPSTIHTRLTTNTKTWYHYSYSPTTIRIWILLVYYSLQVSNYICKYNYNIVVLTSLWLWKILPIWTKSKLLHQLHITTLKKTTLKNPRNHNITQYALFTGCWIEPQTEKRKNSYFFSRFPFSLISSYTPQSKKSERRFTSITVLEVLFLVFLKNFT